VFLVTRPHPILPLIVFLVTRPHPILPLIGEGKSKSESKRKVPKILLIPLLMRRGQGRDILGRKIKYQVVNLICLV